MLNNSVEFIKEGANRLIIGTSLFNKESMGEYVKPILNCALARKNFFPDEMEYFNL